jgi:hypothetical protein
MELPSLGDFYKKYKKEPEKSRAESFELGQGVGHELMTKLHLKGNDLDTLATLVNAYMGEVKSETTARVEGNKVVYRNRSFCPVMISARAFNQPWLWLDENYAWPFMEGLASVVNPNVKHQVPMVRAKGDLVCRHEWEISK